VSVSFRSLPNIRRILHHQCGALRGTARI